MCSINSDSVVYAWKYPDNQKITGVTQTYVDDSLNAADSNVMRHTEVNLCNLECKPRLLDNFDFSGFQIKTISIECYTNSQSHYTFNLKPTPICSKSESFRLDRALFTWWTHSRPDICCIVNRAVNVSKKKVQWFKNPRVEQRHKTCKE